MYGFKSSTEVYNAKWLNATEVARTFVPTKHYAQLRRAGNTVLLGSRGSGKTTLLKMLKREAIEAWKLERNDRTYLTELPAYEAVYIPFSIHWNIEASSIKEETLQRAIVSIKMLEACISTLSYYFGTEEQKEEEFCKQVIDALEFPSIGMSTFAIQEHLEGEINRIIAQIHRDIDVSEILSKLPSIYYSNCLSTIVRISDIASSVLYSPGKHRRWAFCIDDLEHAPGWLCKELFQEMKNSDERYYLKLTSMPLLPEFEGSPVAGEDFTAIPLWDMTKKEAREFCEELSDSYVKANVSTCTTISDILGHSIAYSENDEDYSEDSAYIREVQHIAEHDKVFHGMLRSMGIDPSNPHPKDLYERQKLYRKIRQIVFFRQEYTSLTGETYKRKSRKVLTQTLSGVEVLYRISEANPRWLLNLLNSIADEIVPDDAVHHSHNRLTNEKQARIFLRFSDAFVQMLESIAASKERAPISQSPISIMDGIDYIGEYFQEEIYGYHTPINPVMSFTVDENIKANELEALRAAYIKGAIMLIKGNDTGVHTTLIGKRYRLSYRINPAYHLPMRVYRTKNISSIRDQQLEGQLSFHQDLEI